MSAIHIFIPYMPQKSYAYRRGDAQIIYDDDKHAIVIDGGEDWLCEQIIAFCKSHGITHITYILSHWHYDHDRGMKLLLDSSIIVDKIYCPPPSDLTKLRDTDARDDYSRAMQRIAQATNLKKSISYPDADKTTRIKVGAIVCDIWRRSVRPSENVDYQVNNTSLCCYFPELHYVTTGDSINAFDTYLQTKPGPIKVFKIPHHGNACTNTPCSLLKTAGAKLCWYNHAEAYGVGIGGDSFSYWGAKYCKDHGFICLRPFNNIYMTAASNVLTITQNGSTWTYAIPYSGEAFEGWTGGGDTWRYQRKDGTYATGWAFLKWSGGENWFLFDSDGICLHGWHKVNGYWYWLDPKTCAMQTGWLDYNGRKCYLEPEAGKNQGHAYMSETAVIDGKTYRFDSNCYAEEVDGSAPIPSGRPDIKQNSGFKGYNVSKRSDPIMYIVIHYTGAEGTAKNNVDYFNGGNRSASADFFVGHDGEIWQYNPNIEKQYSWHCGGGRQSSKGGKFFGKCKNANSIGIELCTHKSGGEWIFYDATIEAARILVRYLMETYNIKQSNVIRHYDVNGKNCPAVYGWAGDNAPKWDKFKASLSESTNYDDTPQIYRVRKSWAEADTQKGAFSVLENAKACASNWSGYHVFDKDGQMIT
jgi:N-acetyl-anhydromuramyl-L-alanine amidase AmpD